MFIAMSNMKWRIEENDQPQCWSHIHEGFVICNNDENE
jgi:carbonic anhydrase